MKVMKRKALLLVVSSFALAAVMGGSLGLAFAGQRGALSSGFNLVGGPLSDSVTPQKFVSCLGTSWDAVYIWDGSHQQWQHYFRAAPAYVNGTNVGGISAIPQFAGVVVIMNQAVSNPFLPDSSSEACP